MTGSYPAHSMARYANRHSESSTSSEACGSAGSSSRETSITSSSRWAGGRLSPNSSSRLTTTRHAVPAQLDALFDHLTWLKSHTPSPPPTRYPTTSATPSPASATAPKVRTNLRQVGKAIELVIRQMETFADEWAPPKR